MLIPGRGGRVLETHEQRTIARDQPAMGVVGWQQGEEGRERREKEGEGEEM